MKIKMYLKDFKVTRKKEDEPLFEKAVENLARKTNFPLEVSRQLLFINMISEFDPEIMDTELKSKKRKLFYKVKIDEEEYSEWIEDAKEEILITLGLTDEDNEENSEYDDKHNDKHDDEHDNEHDDEHDNEHDDEHDDEHNDEHNDNENSINNENDKKNKTYSHKETLITDKEELIGKEFIFTSTHEWAEFKKEHNLKVWVPDRLLQEGIKIIFEKSEDGF